MSRGRRVVIIGGGVMGAATAYFLVREHGLAAVVLERDPSYRHASSALSASSIRQQFSNPINIRLSQASLDFYRRIDAELRVDAPIDIGLTEPGYLFLASAAGAATLRECQRIQVACGARIALLGRQALCAGFPWLRADDIALGVRFEARAATRIVHRHRTVQAVECLDGTAFECDDLVIAAGAWSAPLARQLDFDLPVRARKRDVFVFDTPARLDACPLVIDPAGVWFRPEGTRFICGAPPRGTDVDDAPLEAIDHALFDDVIWPRLARRVPAFEAARVVNAWAGYYEFNTFDCNGLVGLLPGSSNVHAACGFSGHGMQQAPAVGQALAELIATGAYRTLDLSALAPQRLLDGTPLLERNAI